MVEGFAIYLFGADETVKASQGLGGGTPFVFPIERMAFGLLLCFVLAWCAALLIRRYRRAPGGRKAGGFSFLPGAADRRLHVVESRRMGGASEVCLIACDGREYLVAFTAGHALLLRASEVGPAVQDAGLPESVR